MPRLRTFISIGLEPEVRRRTIALQENLAATGVEAKWVEPVNLHVTLLFLGEVDARDTLTVCRAVAMIASEMPAFALRIAGVGCFPNARRPRTLWAGIDEGAAELVRLHDAIEAALIDELNYRREDRPYTPHVTLARVRSSDDTRTLAAALTKLADWSAGTQIVREVNIFSSELTQAGPVYSILGRGKMSGELDKSPE